MELWYHFKHRIFPGILARLVKGLVNILVKTCTVDIKDAEKYTNTGKNDRCVVMFWHNRIVLAPAILYKIAPHFKYGVLISNSKDGEIISSIVNSYDIGYSIRVAHNAKKQAMDEAINFLNEKKGILVITPDGPRGPKYRIKKGAAYIAKSTGSKIMPMSWTADKFWLLKSWDQLIIPKPFSTIKVTFGNPIQMEQSDKLPTKAEVNLIEEQLQSLSNR